jgi:hypothetical protein
MSKYFDKQYVQNAAELLYHVNNVHFTASLAIFAITADRVVALDETAIRATNALVYSLEVSDPRIEDKVALCSLIYDKIKKLPNLKLTPLQDVTSFSNFRDKKLADIMRLAGYTEEESLGGTATYKRIQRRIKASSSTSNQNVRSNIEGQARSSGPTSVSISIQSPVSALTPVSGLTSPSSNNGFTDVSEPNFVTRQPKPSSVSMTDVSKVTTLPKRRKNVAAAQHQRATDIIMKDARSSAFKIGSILLHQQRLGRLQIQGLENADQIATRVNQVFRVELVAGEDLKRSVRENRVGMSPPRHGGMIIVSDDDFKLLYDLVFTCESIEQANGDPNRLDRPRMTSAIAEVINEKHRSEGRDEICARAFYRRIEKEASRTVTLSSPCYREALRAAWCTHENFRKNYNQWERCLVEYGFGRWPENDEDIKKHGNVVLFEGQAQRIVQFDEMGFSFDGSKNGKGGRPAAVSTNPDVSDPKQPTSKSAQKVSCMFGMNFAYEAIPPMFVVTSKAEGMSTYVYLVYHFAIDFHLI